MAMKAMPGCVDDEGDRVGRREPLQHAGLRHDPADPGGGQRAEPEQHDRPEQRAHLAGAEALHGEQGGEDHRRDRHDEVARAPGRRPARPRPRTGR